MLIKYGQFLTSHIFSVKWYLSILPLCSGWYGSFLIWFMCRPSRYSVIVFENSLHWSVLMLIIANGNFLISSFMKSFVFIIFAFSYAFEYTLLVQSSIQLYMTNVLWRPKGYQVSTCISIHGISNEYIFRCFFSFS